MTFILSRPNHHAGDQVGHRILSILHSTEHELIFYKFSRELFHLWHVLFLEELADFLIGVDLLFVKYPCGQGTGSEQIMAGVILASACICENALTNGNRSLYFGGHHTPGDRVEIEIHYVEVESPVNSAHEGHIAVPVMGKLVTMTAQDTVNSPFRQSINKVNHFIIFA